MTSSLTPAQVDALLAAAGSGSVVHLVGAGGCGMSGLGHLLLDRGHRVTGSDLVLNEETRQLQARGAVIHSGHAAGMVEGGRPVLVVFTPAVRSDNVELQAARAAGLPTVRRAVLLAALLSHEESVAVAGMHGKTTTSALLAFALQQLGASPSYAIGSRVPQLEPHARLLPPAATPARPWFVFEADESDGTLPLFHPRHALLLNVDAEHLDHFADLDAVGRDFGQLAAQTKGLRIYCQDDPGLCRLVEGWPSTVSFGFDSAADYRAALTNSGAETVSGHPASSFEVWHQGSSLGRFTLQLLGEKNVSNATAVVAFLHQLGFAPKVIAPALAAFRGAARRQQELFANGQVRVFDDYGHHPTEIRATLQALQQLGGRRLLVAFQPHRFTRTRHLMGEFATAFAGADELWLTEIYAASEPTIPGVSSAVLAAAIRAHGQAVHLVPDLNELGEAVIQAIRPGDVVLFLGAGDITRVAHEVAERLAKASEACRAGSAGFQPAEAISKRRSSRREEAPFRVQRSEIRRTSEPPHVGCYSFAGGR
ncbi:MAG: UDP-N-acetylmuramate--L-alanine ligase [Verrucomicrobia bacterium]|nr:UDP-N-acetylmuramate--L-alanine ligase [Verrucomicrobiota bacterium]